MPRAWRALLVAAAVTGWSAPAAASPQEVVGFGYRSIGMGNSGAAVGEGTDTVYGNPALLSLSRQTELEFGLMGSTFDLYAEGPTAPGRISYAPFRGSTLGGVLPLPFGGVLRDRVVVGIGFITPLDVVVRGRILYPETPQFLIADRVQSVAIQAAIGLDLGYGMRLGGGFGALAALTGSVRVARDASGRIGTVVEDTLVASYAPVVGASYDLGDSYRLGLAFRGELVGRFNVVIVAEDLGQLDIPPLNISGVAQYDPWQLALEFARVAGPWRAAVGVTYKHWPAYPGPVEATVRCEDSDVDVSDCLAPTPPDPGYIPAVAPHVGVERRIPLRAASSLALRGGYAFEPSPAPEQTGVARYFDNHRSVFSLGWGLGLGNLAPVAFDGFVQLQVLHPRTHVQSIAGGALADGTIETHGFIGSAGVSGRLQF